MNVLKSLIIFVVFVSSAMAQTQNGFDKEKDLFVAQFDNLPDNDDVHSQAAVACLLAHPDFKGVNYFCVAGAWGNQQNLRNAPKMKYIDSSELFKLAFGAEAKPDSNKKDLENARWVNAHGKFKPKSELTKERIERLEFASGVLRDRTKPILEAGGNVWVMEAGQSDLTSKWVAKLIEAGVTNTKTHVVVVQHSGWNERATTRKALAFVRANTKYTQIDDGNKDYETGKDRGDNSPNYNNETASFMKKAIGDSNSNKLTRSYWKKAKEITDATSYRGPISRGGVDFSDTVEAMWIFDLAHKSAGLTTVQDFWDKFVLKTDEGARK